MAKTRSRFFLFFLVIILLTVRNFANLEPKLQLSQTNDIIKAMKNLPLYFVENRGQVDNSVKYHLRALHGNVYFTPEVIVYQFIHRKDEGKTQEKKFMPNEQERSKKVREVNIRLSFVGMNERVKLDGLQESEGKVSYFRGNDPQKWVKDAQTYHRIIYKELYPRIDLIVCGSGGKIKHEYRVRTGGDVKQIKVKYEGIEQLRINEEGQLEVETSAGVLREDKPLSYQEIDAQRVKVETAYVMESNNTIKFKIGAYSKDKELIIDPGLDYSTYLGGGSYDYGYGIAVDESGNAYVTGYTQSSNFPVTWYSYDRYLYGGADVFITKLNSAGTGIYYSTYLGGGSYDYGYGIAVDENGNAYISGYTNSDDFPTTASAYDTSHNGSYDAFITKLDSAGSYLYYSTYSGGDNDDRGYGIAIDGSGNAYVTGWALSTDFPTSTGAYNTSHSGSYDAFISKVNPAGSGTSDLAYSTYLGGDNDDRGYGIAVDGSGYAYVTGWTLSDNFPTTSGALDTSLDGSNDGFVAKVNPAGSGTSDLVYSTYLGGGNTDSGNGIVIDGSGYACVTGWSLSTDFPTSSSAFDTSLNGLSDAFLTRINPAGNGTSDLAYSTYLGGEDDDRGNGIAIDGSGYAYVAGSTKSSDFPTTTDAFDTSPNSHVSFLT